MKENEEGATLGKCCHLVESIGRQRDLVQRSFLSPSLKIHGRFLQYCGTIRRAVRVLVIVDSLPTCEQRIPIWNYNHCPREFMFSLRLL